MEKNRVYVCIDLKSFFASVESVERGLDPFKDNLVVADPSRGRGAICLAITPSMKALGIKNRCRIFEIPSNVKYICAKPRMKLYMEKSGEIYSVYLNYFCPEDIHVYSIDECFIDITEYLKLYNMSPVEIAKMLTDAVFEKTGIRASVGIGTNLFLAKIALDISAKKSKDFIGYLDQELFKKEVWHHKPITDIWNIGHGVANRLKKYGVDDLYGVAYLREDILYKEFGINAELLIDHSKGIEPCTIKDIHSYKSKTSSFTNSQILFEDYKWQDAITILKEMVDQMSLSLIETGYCTNSVSLSVSYSDRNIPSVGGMIRLAKYTNNYSYLIKYFNELFEKFVDKKLLIRRISICVNNIIKEEYTPIDIFSGYDKINKEKEVSEAVINIKNKYGKNSILKGISYQEKATQKLRNKLIGGHNGGEDDNGGKG